MHEFVSWDCFSVVESHIIVTPFLFWFVKQILFASSVRSSLRYDLPPQIGQATTIQFSLSPSHSVTTVAQNHYSMINVGYSYHRQLEPPLPPPTLTNLYLYSLTWFFRQRFEESKPEVSILGLGGHPLPGCNPGHHIFPTKTKRRTTFAMRVGRCKRGTLSDEWFYWNMNQKLWTAGWHFDVSRMATFNGFQDSCFPFSGSKVDLGETFWDFQVLYPGLLLTSSDRKCKTQCVNLLSRP